MERLFLVREFLWRELGQEDCLALVLTSYVPLFNAELERILIDRVVESRNHKLFKERLHKTLTNRHMILDPRIKDGRLERLITFLENHSHISVRNTKKIGRFFLRAYLFDNTMLMRLLGIHNFLYSVPLELIDTLMEQVDSLVLAVDTWIVLSSAVHKKYEKQLGYIIQYCLDQKREEPLLKWITYKNVMGGDLVQHIVNDLKLSQSEYDYYQTLRAKYESLEMKNKRRNVLLYRRYQD